MDSLNPSAVLHQFDTLVSSNQLFYSPSEPKILDSGGHSYDFRIVPSFASKPQSNPSSARPTSPSPSALSTPNRPPPSDGSDIDHSDPAFHLLTEPPHKLILNKYCLFRPQSLLLTLDPTARQTSPLGSVDLGAAWRLLGQMGEGGEGGGTEQAYMLYNCGPEAGSSRKHKHMQILPQPGVAGEPGLRLPPYRDACKIGAGQDGVDVLEGWPCVVFHEDLTGLSGMGYVEAGEVLGDVMEKHVKACRRAVARCDGGGDGVGEMPPHNVLLTRSWMLTVPRRRATLEALEGHVLNAAGMVGAVWCSNEAQFEAWKGLDVGGVLGALGVPGR